MKIALNEQDQKKDDNLRRALYAFAVIAVVSTVSIIVSCFTGESRMLFGGMLGVWVSSVMGAGVMGAHGNLRRRAVATARRARS